MTLGALLTGCASQNYDFSQATNASGRVASMSHELNRLQSDPTTDEDDLYDFSVIPLIHSRLHVFSEQDEEGSDAKFIEADLESTLPLFAFAHGRVSEYDEDEELLTRNEFKSTLWGAFREERKLTVTDEGWREKTKHTIFWIFSWWGDEHILPFTRLNKVNQQKLARRSCRQRSHEPNDATRGVPQAAVDGDQF